MNVQQALRDAKALAMAHGLRRWTVKLDNARARAGRCTYSTRTISLSRYLIAASTPDEVRNTVLHEIAHALVGKGHGHDATWRRMHRSIGGNAARTHKRRLETRYVGTCPNGHEVGRHRLAPESKRKRSSCLACAPGKFDARFLISWVDRGLQVR